MDISQSSELTLGGKSREFLTRSPLAVIYIIFHFFVALIFATYFGEARRIPLFIVHKCEISGENLTFWAID